MKLNYLLFFSLLSSVFIGCNKEPEPLDIPCEMFCITALEDGLEVSMEFTDEDYPHMELSLQYSLNGEKWTDFIIGQSVVTLSKAGYKLYMKANRINTAFACDLADDAPYNSNCAEFKFSRKAKVSGNIMYLLDGEHPDEAKMDELAFSCMFMNESMLMDASELLLPSQKLSEGCYMEMFEGTSIIKAPELPATELSAFCYTSMFINCTNLTSAPNLPAVKLDEHCYRSMFSGCSSLATAPALPATKLVYCCYDLMFDKCTSLTEAPVLPATELAPYCYCLMFRDCSSLKSLTCLATDISAKDCTYHWLDNVAAQGTLYAAPGTDWTGRIPSTWTVK